MMTIPTNVSKIAAHEKAVTADKEVPCTGLINETSFDRLFAAVFDSMKMQELAGTADLRNMLTTIASISNYHSR